MFSPTMIRLPTPFPVLVLIPPSITNPSWLMVIEKHIWGIEQMCTACATRLPHHHDNQLWVHLSGIWVHYQQWDFPYRLCNGSKSLAAPVQSIDIGCTITHQPKMLFHLVVTGWPWVTLMWAWIDQASWPLHYGIDISFRKHIPPSAIPILSVPVHLLAARMSYVPQITAAL